MATSDKKPGQGASNSISFGEKELIFARELFGKLSSHALSIHDLEGWADGTLPDSLKTALSQEDYTVLPGADPFRRSAWVASSLKKLDAIFLKNCPPGNLLHKIGVWPRLYGGKRTAPRRIFPSAPRLFSEETTKLISR